MTRRTIGAEGEAPRAGDAICPACSVATRGRGAVGADRQRRAGRPAAEAAPQLPDRRTRAAHAPAAAASAWTKSPSAKSPSRGDERRRRASGPPAPTTSACTRSTRKGLSSAGDDRPAAQAGPRGRRRRRSRCTGLEQVGLLNDANSRRPSSCSCASARDSAARRSRPNCVAASIDPTAIEEALAEPRLDGRRRTHRARASRSSERHSCGR